MNQRTLSDAELRALALTTLGVALPDIMDTYIPAVSADEAYAAVVPFLAAGVDAAAVKAAIEAVPRVKRVEIGYRQKLETILQAAEYTAVH